MLPLMDHTLGIHPHTTVPPPVGRPTKDTDPLQIRHFDVTLSARSRSSTVVHAPSLTQQLSLDYGSRQ
ncbi:uncharacterized [Tachysurus ichikawai]